jgi:hypothetical protein
LLVVVVSYVIGLIHQDVFLSAEILSRTHPNILDLMIALGGGAAGGLATINKRISQGLVGTAIATALVPPLASCGICLAHGETRLGWGAFLLFFANLVAIQFASSVVLWVAGFHDLLLFKEKRSLYLLRNGVSVVLLLAMGGTFAVNFADSVASQNYEARVRSILVRALRAYPGTHLADVAITRSGNRSIILAVVRTPYSLSPDRISGIEALLPGGSRESELHVQSVIVKEATSRGYLHETKQAEAPEEGLKNPLPPAELDDSSPPQGEAQRDADTRTSTP